MTPERWRQVTEVFHAARARDAATRGELLDQRCAGDPDLRAEVEEMLAAHRDAGGFGEEPAFTLPEVTPSRIGPYRVVRELELMEKGLGPDHPDLKDLRRSYARFLRERGRDGEAAEAERLTGARATTDARP